MSSASLLEYPESSSYREYIDLLTAQYPEYEWLQRFLSESGGQPQETDLRVFETTGSKIHMHTFLPTSPRAPQLRSLLAETPADVETRLIYISFRYSWSIDRAVIETLGELFHINPQFFWGAFQHYTSSAEPLCPRDLRGPDNRTYRPWVEPLPSQRISLNMELVNVGMSALFLDADTEKGVPATEPEPSVLLLCRCANQRCHASIARIYNNRLYPALASTDASVDTTDLSTADAELKVSYANKMLSAQYRHALTRLTAAEIKRANHRPVEFLYPFAQLLINEASARVQSRVQFLEHEYLFGAAGNANTQNLQGIWAVLHDIEVDLVPTLAALRAFLPPRIDPTTDSAAAILGDYEHVLDSLRSTQGDLRDYLNRHVSMKSLEESRIAVLESRRSIELADSVKRLTVLALVFVPLSLVTGVFGMNVREFGQGDTGVWIFVVVSVVVLVLGVAVVGVVGAWKGRGRK